MVIRAQASRPGWLNSMRTGCGDYRYGASSAKLYAESFATDLSRQELGVPVAVSVFPGEFYRPLKIWGERTDSKLFYWNKVSKGGHFATFEQPSLFVVELRACLARLR